MALSMACLTFAGHAWLLVPFQLNGPNCTSSIQGMWSVFANGEACEHPKVWLDQVSHEASVGVQTGWI